VTLPIPPIWLIKVWSWLRSVPAWIYAIAGWGVAFLVWGVARRRGHQARISAGQVDAILEHTGKIRKVTEEHRARVAKAEEHRATKEKELQEKEREITEAASSADSAADLVNKSFGEE